MRSYDKRKKNNIIIGSLLGVLLLMVVGYAAFNSVLNISGTSSISSNWNILITNVTSKNIIGGASNAEDPKWDKLTATFKTNLTAPGDSIEYDITVSNKGNLNATLDKITLSDPNNDAIIFTTSGLTEGDTLAAGQNQVLTVKVEYDKNVTTQPESTEGNLTVTLDFVQEGKEINSPVKNPANVEITSVEPTNAVGLASVAAEPTYYGLNARLKTNLTNQDDSLEYNITIQNQGDEDAVLTGVTVNEENKIATITSSGVTEGETLQGNGTKVMTVRVAKAVSAPEGQVESDLNVSLDYENKEDVSSKTYTVTYNYKANGGQSSNAENASLEFGNKVNLEYTAEKEGSRFIGWNTDKNATSGLNDLTVTGKNLTLYAIFKENKLTEPTVEIQKGETSADVVITYPSGCADGKVCKYSINEVEQTVTTSPVELTITEDTKLVVTTSFEDETQTVEKTIDFTAPEVSVNVSVGTSTLTAVIDATDTLSEITKYEFSIDDGEGIDNKTNNVYTFTGLDQNTNHTIKVRVTNSIDLSNEASKEVTTKNLEVPTYEETDSENGKIITITYPEGCGDSLTCSYIKDSGEETPVTEKTVTVEFTESGTLVAKINDGRNSSSSSYTVEIKSLEITVGGQNIEVVKTGDGLYKDTTEEGRYIYRGASPSNYITFNNETWRVMSVESDGTLKIIRNESIGNMAWDTKGTRNKSTSTYCTNANINGCNAWASTSNLVDTPSVFTLHNPNGNPNTDTTVYSGTVTKDSSLNTYLNNTYLGTINEDSKYIVNHNFNVGTPGSRADTEDIATDVQQEALYKWNGKIGLMTMTELLKTTTSKTCVSLVYASNSHCNGNNWMWPKSGDEWTISPYVFSQSNSVWYIKKTGLVKMGTTFVVVYGVRPVLYLTSDITLSGEGTESSPYTIVS